MINAIQCNVCDRIKRHLLIHTSTHQEGGQALTLQLFTVFARLDKVSISVTSNAMSL